MEAVVIFQVIDSPLGELSCIGKFMLKAARIACAGVDSGGIMLRR